MKVLVCGGRDYSNYNYLEKVLDGLFAERPFFILIHGNARGADKMAGLWAKRNGVQEVVCPANWDYFSVGAGPIRNEAMLKLEPDLVVAFPGGSGTANMISKAKNKGIEVYELCNS